MSMHAYAIMIKDNLINLDQLTILLKKFSWLKNTSLLKNKKQIDFSPKFWGGFEKNTIATGYFNEWTIIWGLTPYYDSIENLVILVEQMDIRNPFILLEPILCELSLKTQICAWAIEGTSGVFGYDWFVNGKMLRSWWEFEEKIIIDKGNTLLNEAVAFKSYDSDWAVVSIVESLTLSLEDIEKINFTLYTL